MGLATEMLPLEVSEIKQCAAAMKEQGWRYVQMLCVNTDNGIDVLYTYNRDDVLRTYAVRGVQKDEAIPSVTDLFLAAFVFENEAHDLFGVNFINMKLDFGGHFFSLAETSPMTVITPEMKAEREKAAKARAAKAAKEAKAAREAAEAKSAERALTEDRATADAAAVAAVNEMAPAAAKADKPSAEERAAMMEAKLANMEPEKAAKVRAALEAKAARDAAKDAAAPAPAEPAADAKEGE